MDEIPETLKAGFQHIRAESGLSQTQVLKAYARYRPEAGRKMLLSEFMALKLWQHKTVPAGYIGTREASEFALKINFQPHRRGLVQDKLLFYAALAFLSLRCKPRLGPKSSGRQCEPLATKLSWRSFYEKAPPTPFFASHVQAKTARMSSQSPIMIPCQTTST